MADGSNRAFGTVSTASTSSATNTPSTTPRLATSVASPLYYSTGVPQQQLSSPLMLVQQGVVSAENQLRSVRSPAPTATLFPVAHPVAPQYRLIVLNAPVQTAPAAMSGLLTTPPAAAQQQLSTAIRMHQQAQQAAMPTAQTVITANQQNVVMPISSVSPASGLSSPPVVFSPHQQHQQQQQSLNLVNLAAAARAVLPQQIAAAQSNALLASGLRNAIFASANPAQSQNPGAAMLNQQTLVALSAAAAQQQQQQQHQHQQMAASRQFVLMPDGNALPRPTGGMNMNLAQPVVSAAGGFVCFAAPSAGHGSSAFPSIGGSPANILTAATRLQTSFPQQPMQMHSFTVGPSNSLGSQPILLTPIGTSSATVTAAGQRAPNLAFSSVPTTVSLQQATLPDGRRAFLTSNSLTTVSSSPSTISFVPHELNRTQTFLYQAPPQQQQQQLQVIGQQTVGSDPSTSAAVFDYSKIKVETPHKQQQNPSILLDDMPPQSMSSFSLPTKRPASVLSAATEPGWTSSGKKARAYKHLLKDGNRMGSSILSTFAKVGAVRDDAAITLPSSMSWNRPLSEPVIPERKPRPLLTKPLNEDGSEENDADREHRLKELRSAISRLSPQRLKWLLHLLSTNNLKLLRYLSVVGQSIDACEKEISEKSSSADEQTTMLRYDLGRLIRQRSLAEQVVTRAAQQPEITIRHLMHPNDWQRLLAMLRKVAAPDYSDDGDNALTAEEKFLLDRYEFYIKSFEKARNHPNVLQNYFSSTVSAANDAEKLTNGKPRRRRRRSGSSSDADEENAAEKSAKLHKSASHVFIQLSRSSTASLRSGYPFRLNQSKTLADDNDADTIDRNRAVIDKLFVTQIESDDEENGKFEPNGKSRHSGKARQPMYKAIVVAQVHVPLDVQTSSETFNSFVETVLQKFYSKCVPPGTLVRYRYADDMIDNDTTEMLRTTPENMSSGLFSVNSNLGNVRKIVWDPDQTCWREIITVSTGSGDVADSKPVSSDGPLPSSAKFRPPPLLSGGNAMPRVLKTASIADRMELGQVRPRSIVEQAMDTDYETLLASMCGSSRTAVVNAGGSSSAVSSATVGGSSTTETDANGNGIVGTNGVSAASSGNSNESMLVSALRSELGGAALQHDVRRVCEPFWLVDADMANDRAWIQSVGDNLERQLASTPADSVVDKKHANDILRAVDLCETRETHCARQLRLVGKSLKDFDLQLNRGVGVLKTYRRRRPERVRKAVKKFEVED